MVLIKRKWVCGLQHLVLIFSRHGLTKDAKYYEEEYYKWEKTIKEK